MSREANEVTLINELFSSNESSSIYDASEQKFFATETEEIIIRFTARQENWIEKFFNYHG